MRPALIVRSGVILFFVLTAVPGCGYVRQILGYPAGADPTVEIRSAEPRWLLIKNPRFGDVPSEPEYIWVEEDKVPTTMKTLVFGSSSIIAPPEIAAKYGPPPGGGRISPRQKMPVGFEPAPPPARGGAGTGAPGAPPAGPPRGLVVFVEPSRIVIDLTAKDGIRAGASVSVRRDRIPIVHPMTGELLGELDEELASGTVVELREKFSVVELQSIAPGAEIRIKDRVVVR
jgi:hypothetical protein